MTKLEHRYVELSDSKGRKFKIDIDDYERVVSYPKAWRVKIDTVVKKTKTVTIFRVLTQELKLNKDLSISHFLMGKPLKGYVVDHINGNTLDNRKCNLRVVTRSENNRNRIKTGKSKYYGVSFNKKREKWYSQIQINKKNYHLGAFDQEIEAARAYNKFCIENNISCARLNDV